MKLKLLAMATLGMMAAHLCGFSASTTATRNSEKDDVLPADLGQRHSRRPTNEAPQPGPTPSIAPQGYVVPTAADGRGGATSYTETMPLDGRSLVEMRKCQIGRPELRGAWITRFDWVRRANDEEDEGTTVSNRDAITSRIRSIMQQAKSLNLNAVFFQVRGDATTLYPSQLEPWSQRFDGKDPGFDPVKFAIDEAHKQGLEFHAYLNPIPCSEETSSPANPNHVWYKHCLPDSKPNWLVYENGAPAPKARQAALSVHSTCSGMACKRLWGFGEKKSPRACASRACFHCKWCWTNWRLRQCHNDACDEVPLNAFSGSTIERTWFVTARRASLLDGEKCRRDPPRANSEI